MIELSNVGVRFGRTAALADVDLAIAEGITGLFGPNASGKSTLLRVLAGLQRPTTGTVSIDGRPLTISDEGWRGRVGFAGHGSGLYGRLTLRENLGLFARLHGVPAGAVDRAAEDLALTESLHQRVGAMSAGTKRRAAVSRALLHDPEILLLDEPYANLDDDAAALVSRAVTGWLKPGRIAVVATHGAKRVREYAGAGIVLRRGYVARVPSYDTPGVTA